MVARRVAVIKWLISEPVRNGVDTEGSLLNEEDAKDSGVDETTYPVTPPNTCDKARENQTHKKHDLEVVTVLPLNHLVFIQV
jgi:hypothetical protein